MLAAKGNGSGFGIFANWKAPWDKTEEKTPAQLEAKAWIDAWKAKQQNQNERPSAEEWIQNWKNNQKVNISFLVLFSVFL